MRSNLGENVYAEGRQAEDAGRNLQGQNQQRQQRFANNAAQGKYPYAQEGSEKAAATGADRAGAVQQQVQRRMGAEAAAPAQTFRELEDQGKPRPAPPPPAPVSTGDPSMQPTTGAQGGYYTTTAQTSNVDPTLQPEVQQGSGLGLPEGLEIRRHPDGREYLYDPRTESYGTASDWAKDKPPSPEVLKRVYGMDDKTALGLQDPANWKRYQQAVWGDQYDNMMNNQGYGWSSGQQIHGGFIGDNGLYYSGGDPRGQNSTWLLDANDLSRGVEGFLSQYGQDERNPNAVGNQSNIGSQQYIRDQYEKALPTIKELTAQGIRVAFNPVTGKVERADDYFKAEDERLAPARAEAERQQQEQMYMMSGADENEERKRLAGIQYTDRSGQTHYPWDEDQQTKDELGMSQWYAPPKFQTLNFGDYFNKRFGG